MNRAFRTLQFVVIIILIVMVAFFIPKLRNLTSAEISELMPDSVTLAAVILFIIFCIKSIIIVIPMIALYISAGLILPPEIAVIFTLISVAAEMTIGFFAGKKLGHSKVKKIAGGNKYAGKLFNKMNDNVFISSFLLRFIPIFSLDLISMIFGAADVKYSEFLLGSVLGIIPGLVPIVLAGNSITDPLSREFLIPFSIFAVLSLFCTIIYWVKNKKQNDKGCKKRV